MAVQPQEANWRDMLLFLGFQYPRLVLPADSRFLSDITALRNQLVHGEILTVDLPRPRSRLELAENAHYHHLRGEVLRFLYQREAKAA